MRKKTLTKEKLREFAHSCGIDLLGVANIERFENAPKEMHPASIFPETRSVIVVARRIVRGCWRGIEEGTHWLSYTYFGYHGLLNTLFLPLGVYEIACFIEDHGWEAVPYYPGVPEAQPPNKPLRDGTPPPDVHLAIRLVAVAAGIGEIGWSKVLLTRKFGPRQRLAAILTDIELEPDELVKPGSICDRCMACVHGCPCDAIPHVREGKVVSVKIGEYTYEWVDVDFGKCTLSYHGFDPRVSPFLHKSFPGLEFDVRKQRLSEEVAYKLCWTLSTGRWRRTREDPSGFIVEGHSQIQRWGVGGSYGICASRGCMRSCFDHLERTGKIEQTFQGGPFIKRKRWLLPCKVPPTTPQR